MKENTVKRENWSSRLGFLVSCIGSAVGMGNIWLFPSRVAHYGGAFLLAYLFFNLTIGICGLIGEMSFGRKARAGSMGAFARAAQARGKKRWGSTVGLLPTVTSFLLAVGYAVVISWILRYVALSFQQILTGHSVDMGARLFSKIAAPFGSDLFLLLSLVLTVLVLGLGVVKGVERVNKVLIPLVFVLFLLLAIYVAFLPGAEQGYRHLFRIRGEVLRDPMMWVYALG